MLQLIVDTNLFHEFRALNQLAWSELGEQDAIVLLVTDPVQSELDAHKKSTTPRLRRRALELTRLFKIMFERGEADHVVREAGPRVVLRLDETPPPASPPPQLDPRVPDERIVSIALAIRDAAPDGARTAVFADDQLPLRKARAAGLEAISIPDAWRRPEEESADTKALARLTAEVAALKRDLPDLHVAGPKERLDLVRTVYSPLSEAEIETLVADLAARCPVERESERGRRKIAVDLLATIRGEVGTFVPPSAEAIAAYHEAHAEWLDGSRMEIETLDPSLSAERVVRVVRFALTNDGGRPADDVLVTLRCDGPIRIAPAGDRDVADAPVIVVLQPPPKAPQGTWRKGRSSLDALRSVLGPTYPGPLAASHHRLLSGVRLDRDAETFFLDARDDAQGILRYRCARFRHGGAAETFSIGIAIAADAEIDDGATARVVMRVEAANLAVPVERAIRLRLRVEEGSTVEAVRAAIDGIADLGGW